MQLNSTYMSLKVDYSLDIKFMCIRLGYLFGFNLFFNMDRRGQQILVQCGECFFGQIPFILGMLRRVYFYIFDQFFVYLSCLINYQ